MTSNNTYDVIIIGGGLAGLSSSILLGKSGLKVLLVEKKSYPFHKVCGEYLSNETKPFLKSLGIDPEKLGASEIRSVRISSPSGKNLFSELELGGFGLSRYILDDNLFSITQNFCDIKVNTKVTSVHFNESLFHVALSDGKSFASKFVIGSYGKRDTLDKNLNRDFLKNKTGYMAVKYHIKTDYQRNEIGLDNFKNGYCGIVKIEDERYNLCYLSKRSNMEFCNSISEMEKNVLYRNPRLKELLINSDILFEKPLAINEISFDKKEIIKDHIWMVGDTAGLITPLCGNGMSMALHSAKIACDHILKLNLSEKLVLSFKERAIAEKNYIKDWRKNFAFRVFAGRQLQKIFGGEFSTEAALRTIKYIPPLKRMLIRSTHGREF